MGTSEKLGVNIHVDQLMDTIASNCSNLERLELRYANVEHSRKLFSDDALLSGGTQRICAFPTRARRRSTCCE